MKEWLLQRDKMWLLQRDKITGTTTEGSGKSGGEKIKKQSSDQ